jgi:twinkle protein
MNLIPPSEIEFVQLQKRGLWQKTCEHFKYGVTTFNGRPAQVAQFTNEAGQVVAQKLRFADKSFLVLGDMKQALLFGQHLWKSSGKKVVITEGEIDAMSMSQVQGNSWPVVSVPNGAAGARKALEKAMNWLNQFEDVVLMFDNDDAGRAATAECVSLFKPNRCKIASLPLKDANGMLVAGRATELQSAMWNARTFRPDGIVGGDEVWELLTKKDTTRSVPYPWSRLQEMTRGLRTHEIVTICAGSGVGKSAICREIAFHLIQLGEKVGYIALEESVRRTALGILGIAMNRPIHLDIGSDLDPKVKAEWERIRENVFFYDHFGSLETENLLNKVRYMVVALGCQWIVLDHVSIVVSGMEDGDERRNIDNLMTQLRSLVQETGCGLILVSHLKRPDGKGHEEGAVTSLSQLRGSAAIGQLSDMVIGAERNQQGDPSVRNLTFIRELKNRWTGETGPATCLVYDKETGRLTESDVALEQLDSEKDDGSGDL